MFMGAVQDALVDSPMLMGAVQYALVDSPMFMGAVQDALVDSPMFMGAVQDALVDSPKIRTPIRESPLTGRLVRNSFFRVSYRRLAASLAESLWLSVEAPQSIGGYAAEAQPHTYFLTHGKP